VGKMFAPRQGHPLYQNRHGKVHSSVGIKRFRAGPKAGR
jgi:hypothetical protein